MFAGCRCPRCPEAVLVATKREGHELLACRHCGGAFVSANVGLRLMAVLKPDVPPAHAHGPRSPCPVCRKVMRLVLASRAGVEVDVCATHGVWFDGDDLAAVLQAVAHALGKPVPRALDSLEQHARGRRESPADPSPPAPPPPQASTREQPSPIRARRSPDVPVVPAAPYQRDGLDTALDAADLVLRPVGVAVEVAMIPVTLTVGVVEALVDLID